MFQQVQTLAQYNNKIFISHITNGSSNCIINGSMRTKSHQQVISLESLTLSVSRRWDNKFPAHFRSLLENCRKLFSSQNQFNVCVAIVNEQIGLLFHQEPLLFQSASAFLLTNRTSFVFYEKMLGTTNQKQTQISQRSTLRLMICSSCGDIRKEFERSFSDGNLKMSCLCNHQADSFLKSLRFFHRHFNLPRDSTLT